MDKPGQAVVPQLLFPGLHYPALLAQQAHLLQQRQEKSAFSPTTPFSSLLNLSSDSSLSSASSSPSLTSPKSEPEDKPRSLFSPISSSPPRPPSLFPGAASPGPPYQSVLPSLTNQLLMRHWLAGQTAGLSPSLYPPYDPRLFRGPGRSARPKKQFICE